jgi:very-short-patch-repair endonuclease
LALVDKARNLKIDIEIDADCHLKSDDLRKHDDVWRNIRLQGAEWKVIRFWTYQLQKKMNARVDEVEQIWSTNGQIR